MQAPGALKGPTRCPKGAGIRFLEDLLANPVDHCVWFLGRQSKYPTVKLNGRTIAAHRLILVILKGEAPPDMEAAHRCGNGHLGCVNQRHLEWATHVDNMADVARLGRTTKPPSYSPEQAAAVAELGAGKRHSHTEIATQIGVSPTQVQRILAAHRIRTEQRRPANKVTDPALIQSIRELAGTMSQTAIATRLGTSQTFVSRQIRRVRRPATDSGES